MPKATNTITCFYCGDTAKRRDYSAPKGIDPEVLKFECGHCRTVFFVFPRTVKLQGELAGQTKLV